MNKDSAAFKLEPIHWVLIAVFTLVWFVSLDVRALITPDEGRYATLSLFMAKTGDWITPRLNGILYFEKPIMQYWMGAMAFNVLGVNEFAARFWPGLTGFATVFLTGWFATRLWNARIGFYAFCVAGSSLFILGNSHFLTLDMGLTFFLTLALGAFLLAQTAESQAWRTRFNWLAWAAISGAMLSKGLVALVIPGMSAIIYMVIKRDWTLLARMNMVSGLLIFALLAGPWFVVVSLRNPGFADFFFIHEHFQRFLTDEARREGPIWYFLPMLIAGMLPWTTWLPGLFKASAAPASKRFDSRLFLIIWSVFTLVFFSVSKSKLPSYILPMFPALAMLVAARIERMSARDWCWNLVLPGALWAASIPLFLLSTRIAERSKNSYDVVHYALNLASVGGLLGFIGVLLSARYALKGDKPKAVLTLAMGGFLAITLLLAGHERYGHEKSAVDIAPLFKKDLAADAPVFSVAYYDQTLPYYLGRTVTLVNYSDEFSFGLQHEPEKGMTLDQFKQKWATLNQGGALMLKYTYEQLQKEGVAMKPVYEDSYRVAVIKP